MSNALDRHVAAYEGGSLYDFDDEILLTWYPKRILQHVSGARSLLELGLGHGFSTTSFSKQFERHIVLDGSTAVIQNFRSKYPECPAEIVHTYFETFNTD
jgi:hypothetical protein